MGQIGISTIGSSRYFHHDRALLTSGAPYTPLVNEVVTTGQVYLESTGGGPSTQELSVYDITSGPNGAVLVGGKSFVMGDGLPPGWVDVDLSSEDIQLTAGNVYAVELSRPTSTGYFVFRQGGLTTSNDNTATQGSSDAVFTETSTTANEYSFYIETVEAVAVGPTITGPDSTTDGTATQATGTDLDTVTTFSLISGTYAVEQTIDSQTATTLDYVASSGVNDCVPGTPVAGVPLEATITAPGITPYVVQQEADDGVNPAATRDITLNAPATHDVVQTMIATANTIDDQSIFGTSWIDVEDNMQAYVPKVVDGVNFTWAADGTFTTDQDKTVNVRVAYLAPSTLQYGCIDFTIQGSSIVSGGITLIPIELESVTLRPINLEAI